jgi:hypothetical protein
MSFWLSAIPVQNCSLNLKLSILKKSVRSQGPTVQTNAGSYDTHATHPHTHHSPLRIVATAREVVQEESRTYSEMTRCVRLFHNTLFPCGSLTHGEIAVSWDAGAWRKTPTVARYASSNFFGCGTGMAEVRLICVGKPIDGGRHEKSDEA